MEFLSKDEREDLLDSIKKLAEIIEQADMQAVNTELKTLKSFSSQKGFFKIKNISYEYDRIAF